MSKKYGNESTIYSEASGDSLENLPPTIFGISTQDALTVVAGLAMAAIGINKIINTKKQ